MKTRTPVGQLNKTVAPYADDIALTASELARRGWAEANAGNISVRLGAWPAVSDLLVKRGNVRMRDLARNPAEGLCVLRFGAGDRSYTVIDGDPKRPETPGVASAPKNKQNDPWYGQLWESAKVADKGAAAATPGLSRAITERKSRLFPPTTITSWSQYSFLSNAAVVLYRVSVGEAGR